MEDNWIKGDYESEHFFSDNEEDWQLYRIIS